jgi:dihydroorotase
VAGILIKGGRVIDPSQEIDRVTDVVIEDGRIGSLTRVPRSGESRFARIVDASGMVVCPGLLDLHVHLREPGQEQKETIRTGTAAAAAGGFVGVACMPNTIPAIDDAGAVQRVIEKAREARFPVWPVAAVSLGREGKQLTEMAELVDEGVIGFSDDGEPVADAHLMRTALEYSRMLGVPIMQHPEEKALTVMGSMHEGRASAIVGLRGIPGIAEDVVVARDLLLAEYTGGHLHVQHVSTARSVELIRQAKKREVHVTCEATPHNLTLTDEDVRASGLDPNFKMYPPLRSAEDVKALRKGIKDGTIDFIASDHAPHHLDDKDCTFEEAAKGIVGLETALGVVITGLVGEGVIDLVGLVGLMSTRPAEVFGLPGGTLKKGSEANVTIFDPQAEWTVDPGKFRTKGRNTPWKGRTLRGRVFAVVVQGRYIRS